MTEYSLTDADGTVRWRGTISPAPGGGSQAVNVATAYVAHADILTLPSSPIELAAAPGAGKMIVPSSALLYCDTSGAPYTNISESGELGPCVTAPGDVLNYLWEQATRATVSSFLGAGGLVAAPFGPQSIFESVFATPLTFPFVFTDGIPPGDMSDKPLLLRALNDADYEEGDPANYLAVSVTYSILDVTAP